MQQYVLFEKDHVAIVRELLDRAPEFGPGDKVLVADDGVTTVIIDRIVEECGHLLYECHTDSLFPVQMYLEREEIFSNKEHSKCLKAWETLESRFFKIQPEKVGIDKCIAFDVAFKKPWHGRRVGRVVFAALSNGKVYEELLGEPAHLINSEDPFSYIDNVANEFEEWAKDRGMCLRSDVNSVYKDIYCYNEQQMSWDGIKNIIPNLRELRKIS